MFNLLAPPAYTYSEETRRSRYLHILILATAGITTLVCIINIFILPDTSRRWFTLIAVLNSISFIFLVLNKNNRYRPSAIGYIIFLSVIIFIMAWSAGGIRAPVIQNIPIAVLIAGLLLNLRAGINTALLAMAGAGMLVFAEYVGILPPSSVTHNPLSIWINYGLTLSMLTLLYYLSLSGRNRALKQAEQELSLRKKAENELREREARYRFISENIDDVIWVIDVQSEKFLFQSSAVIKLRGYTPEEAKDHVLIETITPDSYTKAKNIMNDVIRKKRPGDSEPIKVVSEFDVVHRSGTVIPEEVVATMTFDHQGHPDQIIGISRDIIERKEAEKRIRESEAQLRFISENTGDIIWLMDVKSGRFLFQSDSVMKIRGYTPEEANQQTLEETLTPESYAKALKVIEDVISQRQSGDMTPVKVVTDFDSLHKDGSIVPVEIVATMTFDGQGIPHEIIGVSRDITERKQAEKSLLQSAARLKEAQRIAHLGSWELDIATGSLIWSDEVYNIFEVDKEQFTPSYEVFLNAIYSADRDFVNTHFTESVQNREPYMIIHRLVMADGRIKHVQEQGETHYDKEGRPARTVGTIQDITDQIVAETALLQSEIRYRSLFESAHDAIFLIKDNTYIDCNPSAMRILNCSKEDITGKPLSSFSPETQPDGNSTYDSANKKITDVMSGASQQFDWMFLRPDGTKFNAEVSLNKFILNKETFILAMVRDISERKDAEEKIKASLKEKETLLLELYHRTKNNMQVISAMINMSMDRIKDREALRIINEIDSQIHSMSLVHQKLYESQDLSHISLKEYLNELIIYLKEIYGPQANNLHFSIHGEDILLLIDIAVPLGMVLNELLNNAIKHAFPQNDTGSITITLIKDENNNITLTFSDSGIGLPEDFTVEEHASLGLFTSKAIIEEQLLGHMQHVPGQGTTWTIQLNTNLYRQRV